MSDTETRFCIELAGENSGLLDSISGKSLEDVRRKMIEKMESGLWTLNVGDTLKVVSLADYYRYALAVPPRGIDKTTRAYCGSYNEIDGNWTDIIMDSDGVWKPFRFARLPKMWKTKAGAEKAAAGIYSNHTLAIVQLYVRGAI